MEKKNTFWKKAAAFIGGKGFYIVLAACLVMIAASAWALFRSLSGIDDAQSVSWYDEGAAVTPRPTAPPSPSPAPTDNASDEFEDDVPVMVLQPETPSPSPTLQPREDEAEEAASYEAFVWPVVGEVVHPYSPESLVWDLTMADWRVHTGMDIAAGMGTKVLCASAGTVETVGEDDLLGTYVVVTHGDGLRSLYANLAATPAAEQGDTVDAGTVLGSVGDTALGEIGEEAHLHFAMTRDGEPVDPADYLPRR